MHRPRPIDLDIRRRRLKAADSFAPVSGRAEPSRVPSSKCLGEDTALTGALPGDPFESGCRRSVEAKNFTSADVSFGAMQQPLICRTDPRYDSEHLLT